MQVLPESVAEGLLPFLKTRLESFQLRLAPLHVTGYTACKELSLRQNQLLYLRR